MGFSQEDVGRRVFNLKESLKISPFNEHLLITRFFTTSIISLILTTALQCLCKMIHILWKKKLILRVYTIYCLCYVRFPNLPVPHIPHL